MYCRLIVRGDIYGVMVAVHAYFKDHKSCSRLYLYYKKLFYLFYFIIQV